MMENIELVDDNGDTIVVKPRRGPSDCLATPSIRLSSRCFFKIHALAHVVNYLYPGKEAYMFVLGERMGEGIDIIIPKQEVSGVSVHITSDQVKSVVADISAMNNKRESTNEEIRKFNADAKAKNDKIEKQNEAKTSRGEAVLPLIQLKKEFIPLKITGWAHSHNTMSAFSSSVDEEMHKKLHDTLRLTNLAIDAEVDEGESILLKKFYIFGITVNVYKDECPIVYVSFPCGNEKRLPDRQNHQEIDVQEFEDELMDTQDKERVIEEIATVVEERVKTETRERSGSSWYPWKDSKTREPEPVPVHRSTITQSLDNYYSKKKEPLSTIPASSVKEPMLSKTEGESIDTVLNWKIFKDVIAKDGIILNEMTKIKNLLKNKENFAIMKEAIIQIIIREHELVLHKIHDTVDVVSKKDNETKEKIDTGDEKPSKTIVSLETKRDGAFEDDEEQDDEYRDDIGEPVKCAGCGKKLLHTDDYSGYDDDDGNPLCDECHDEEVKDDVVLEKEGDIPEPDGTKTWACAGCHIALVMNDNFFGDKDKDGNAICTRCKTATSKPSFSTHLDGKTGNKDDSINIDAIPLTCFECHEKLVKDDNYTGGKNADGMLLCTACDKKDAVNYPSLKGGGFRKEARVYQAQLGEI
jgi:hypothetical protein